MENYSDYLPNLRRKERVSVTVSRQNIAFLKKIAAEKDISFSAALDIMVDFCRLSSADELNKTFQTAEELIQFDASLQVICKNIDARIEQVMRKGTSAECAAMMHIAKGAIE